MPERLHEMPRAAVRDHAVAVAPHQQDRRRDALKLEAALQLRQQPPPHVEEARRVGAAAVVAGERSDDRRGRLARARERQLAVGLADGGVHDLLGQRRRQQRAHERERLDDPEPDGMVEAGGRHRHRAAQRRHRVLHRAQRHAAAQRVARDDRGLARLAGSVLDRRRGERVELRKHRPGPQPPRGREARQVQRDRPAPRAREPVEHEPPRVGAVGEPVQQHQRWTVPLQLQHPRVEPCELEPVLDQRLPHPAAAASGAPCTTKSLCRVSANASTPATNATIAVMTNSSDSASL